MLAKRKSVHLERPQSYIKILSEIKKKAYSAKALQETLNCPDTVRTIEKKENLEKEER